MALGLVQSAAFMAFASYGASGFVASPATLTSYLTTFLNGGHVIGTEPDNDYRGFFPTYNASESEWQLVNGDWSLAWGPAVMTPSGSTDTAANSMFVAYSQTTKAYVVAIAGTDYASLYDWKVEDLDVSTMVCWPIGSSNTTAMISQATATGIGKLQAMTSGGQTLAQFLGSSSVTPSGNTLIFAGHSLAGALAPTLAFALFPTASTGTSWDEVVYLGLAGPTAGNGDFASAMDEQFVLVSSGDRNYPNWNVNYHNKHDLVPYAWNDLATLMPTLKSVQKGLWGSLWGVMKTNIASVVMGLISNAETAIENLDYTPINADEVAMTIGSFSVTGDGVTTTWSPTWNPSSLPGDGNPLSKLTELGSLIESAHHDQYLNYLSLIPLQPLNAPLIADGVVEGRSMTQRRLFLALADLQSTVSAEKASATRSQISVTSIAGQRTNVR